MYKVNPASYASAFAIPADVADRHLRMAGKAQLKVLLWLYRNPAATWDINVISRDTGIPADEIDDSMLYWVEAGLVIKDGQTAPQVTVAPAAEVYRAQPVQPVKTELPVQQPVQQKPSRPILVKPSLKDIAARMGESADVRSMYSEAQEIFGRTLGYDVQSSLLIMHDHYGLPVEVILMICNYAKTTGKQGSLAYIMKIGAQWADSGIDNFEKANEKITRLENVNKFWIEFKHMTGVENPLPTAKQSEYFEIWINDYGYDTDVISLAYEKTVEKKGSISFGYMNGILKSWHESGHKTTDDIHKAEAEFAGVRQEKKTKKTSSSPKNDRPPSFDIELALKRSLELDPTKTKKGQ